ncbi:MAG: IS21-like element helper ATPase IstB [Actinomycetota bacterium]
MTRDSISPELKKLMRRLNLSPLLAPLPERLTLARQSHMPHQDFLELAMSDEVERRDRKSALNRARKARLDPAMTLERWDDSTNITYDRALWAELITLRFIEDANNLLVMGPVGVGKTFMANALGHIACRRRHSVLMVRADQMLKRLKAARLDHSHDEELRKLIRVDLLIIDDFALVKLDQTETQDVYDIVVERHLRASTIVTSNREPGEWLAIMADPLLAQSAIDRFQSAAYELVVEGESYRRRQKPKVPG